MLLLESLDTLWLLGIIKLDLIVICTSWDDIVMQIGNPIMMGSNQVVDMYLLLGGFSFLDNKQTCIGKSTMEAKFIALEKATTETEWV